MPRKKLDIDEKQVQELARLGASNVDIAKVVGCSEGTIRARFFEIVDLGRAERRNTLNNGSGSRPRRAT
jgi:DNA-binding NarL/FixJ family response regulator